MSLNEVPSPDTRPLYAGHISDLDMGLFECAYLPAIVASDVLEQNGRTQQERLAATKLIDTATTGHPTVLGALVCGKHPRDLIPGAYVQFLRIAGTSLGDPVTDDAVIDGPITSIVTRLDWKLDAHNRTAVDYIHRPVEQRRHEYAAEALRQLTRNALLHRTYENTHAPVRVTWFDDRIEIMSPGGPYGMVSVDNFGQAGIADYRNPNLAEAMRALGFVQRFGSGLAIARRALDDNGNPPPEFEVTPYAVRATVRRATA